MMDEVLIGSILASTLRVSVPLIFCALAGLFAERSGVVDIGLEGKMLFAAFAAASAGVLTGSFILAILAAAAVAIALSWLHGFACVSYQGDQVVSGVAINIIAVGLTMVLGLAWFKQGGQTPPLPEAVRLSALFPSFTQGKEWGLLGSVFGVGLLSHNVFVYLAILAVPLSWFILWRMRFGLRLRAVGENPAMVDAAGVSVKAMRYAALTINGVLCGLAGSYLVLAQNPSFVREMTAGRGFMALAALIFGKWHPKGALLACLLFGFLDAVSGELQGKELPLLGTIPVDFILILPYVLTVVLLAGFIGKAAAPKALGIPYVKER